jgi:hypothetical protein
MRPRPMYAFRVILLMPRYAYAAYPTVGPTYKMRMSANTDILLAHEKPNEET